MGWIAKLAQGVCAAWLGLCAPALADDLPVVTIGTLAGGTVNWELSTIQSQGFDVANGFHLKTQEYAGNPATQVALQGGAVDAIVTDWIFAAQARAGGLDLSVLPYSTAVGGLMVRDASDVRSLADLKGKKIAIAGGPTDKSWLILRAYGLSQGIDLAADSQQVFAAPPLVMQAALSGEVDGAVNFWNFMAKMSAQGMREVISVRDAASALGLDPGTPLLGYAVRRDKVPAPLVAALGRASRAAKDRLAQDDAAWQALRPAMNAASDAEFIALRDGFRAGIPPAGPVDPSAAEKLFAVLAKLGGAEITGGLTQLPDGLFDKGE